jgi:anaphase-promoting complex subunit 4
VSGARSTKACGLGLPQGVAIVDFSFLDDKSLLVLCSQKGQTSLPERTLRASHANKHTEEPKSVLLRIAYQSSHMPYQEYVAGQTPSILELDGTGSEGVSACFAFSQISGFTPIQMEAQKASDLRGEIPARICLLGRDRAVYKTYVLPEAWDESG